MHERIATLGQSMAGEIRNKTLEMYAPLHPIAPPQRVVRDVAYGPDSRHLLDIHLPALATEGVRPVLVFVHGGGFVGGDKGGPGRPLYDNIGRFAVESGFIGVNITYRLAPEHAWPAGGEDVARSLAFLSDEIGEYGGDANRVALFGHSAGAAHVATFIATPQFREQAPRLRAAILSSGIYDPMLLEEDRYESYFGNNASLLAARSAIVGLAESDVELLLLVAEFDPPDFHRQAVAAIAAHTEVRGHLPGVALGFGHNHFSSPAHYGTPDRELSSVVARFLHRKCQ